MVTLPPSPPPEEEAPVEEPLDEETQKQAAAAYAAAMAIHQRTLQEHAQQQASRQPKQQQQQQQLQAHPISMRAPGGVAETAGLAAANRYGLQLGPGGVLVSQQQFPMLQPMGMSGEQVHPAIKELCDNYFIQESMARRFHDIMRDKMDSFQAVLEKAWAVMQATREAGKSLHVMMTRILSELAGGTFLEADPSEDPDMVALVEKFDLDAGATQKLVQIMGARPDTKKQEIADLDKRLETATHPHSLLIFLLRKIQNGEELPKPVKTPQPHSYLERIEQSKADKARTKRKQEEKERYGDEGPGHKVGRYQSPPRGRGDRDRDRDRERDRDRDRDRDRRR